MLMCLEVIEQRTKNPQRGLGERVILNFRNEPQNALVNTVVLANPSHF
jgi:hypothetical protein